MCFFFFQAEDGIRDLLRSRGLGYGYKRQNAFRKRAFGSKLIESFLPKKSVTKIIDSSGAFIPGHATPTVIIFGRNEPATTNSIHAILGNNSEPQTQDAVSYPHLTLQTTKLE